MNMKKHKIITFFVSFLITKIFCNSPLEANTVFTDGEVKIEDFAVIVTWSKDNTNLGCLFELGYITNADDLAKHTINHLLRKQL